VRQEALRLQHRSIIQFNLASGSMFGLEVRPDHRDRGRELDQRSGKDDGTLIENEEEP
jgi:hypothetical protein